MRYAVGERFSNDWTGNATKASRMAASPVLCLSNFDMPIPKKLQGAQRIADSGSYLDVLSSWTAGWFGPSRMDSKIARARAQDEPVLYAHFLPGLDILLCSVPGARAPYPALGELRQRCLESVGHALEQPIDRLDAGGYWYEFNGLAILVFASKARERTLQEFGPGQCIYSARTR